MASQQEESNYYLFQTAVRAPRLVESNHPLLNGLLNEMITLEEFATVMVSYRVPFFVFYCLHLGPYKQAKSLAAGTNFIPIKIEDRLRYCISMPYLLHKLISRLREIHELPFIFDDYIDFSILGTIMEQNSMTPVSIVTPSELGIYTVRLGLFYIDEKKEKLCLGIMHPSYYEFYGKGFSEARNDLDKFHNDNCIYRK